MYNEDMYLEANPDVALAVRNKAIESGLVHYELFGRAEGRPLVKIINTERRDTVMRSLDCKGIGLEIGPSHNPVAPKKLGFNVDILDHLNQSELKNKYSGQSAYGVNVDNIEEVDYVWNGQPLAEVIGKIDYYDWIIASHVIEHVPDMITFIKECSKLLKSNGRLSLVVPDKRYCFDSLNPCSSTGDFLDAFEAKNSKPTVGKIFDHFANACQLNKMIAWDSVTNGELKLIHSLEQSKDICYKALINDEYIDVHCWRFTPESFRLVLTDFKMLGLVDLEIVDEAPPTGCEFYVTLGKIKNKDNILFENNNRIDVLQKLLFNL